LALPSTIKYEKHDHVAVITIDRPESHNSLSAEMLLGIEEAMSEFDSDPDRFGRQGLLVGPRSQGGGSVVDGG